MKHASRDAQVVAPLPAGASGGKHRAEMPDPKTRAKDRSKRILKGLLVFLVVAAVVVGIWATIISRVIDSTTPIK